MPSILKSVILPLPMLALLLLFTSWLIWRKKAAGKWLLLCAVGFLFCIATPLISDRIAAPLELSHAPYQQHKLIDNIMVLGCQHQQYAFLPLSSQIHPCSLNRLIEGITIWHKNPQATLYLSGHLPSEQGQHTEILARLAIELGVNPGQIVRVDNATNTQQEAAALAPLIVDQRNVLVTSAMHMPRARNWFNYYGAEVIAAPTHFQIRRPLSHQGSGAFIPNISALQTFSYAQYEYLGLLQQKWKLWWDIENP